MIDVFQIVKGGFDLRKRWAAASLARMHDALE
jgi:hypothetical protein